MTTASERNSLEWLHKHVPWLCTNITVHGPCHSPTFTAEMTMRGQVFRASASTKKKAKAIVASEVVAALSGFQLKTNGLQEIKKEGGGGGGGGGGGSSFHSKRRRKLNRKRSIAWNAVSILNDMRPHIKFVKSIVECTDFNNDKRQIELLNSRSQSSTDHLHQCSFPSSSTPGNSESGGKKSKSKFLVAMTVTIDGRKFVGVGRCQKSAKQEAAREALKEVFSLNNMFT